MDTLLRLLECEGNVSGFKLGDAVRIDIAKGSRANDDARCLQGLTGTVDAISNTGHCLVGLDTPKPLRAGEPAVVAFYFAHTDLKNET